MKLFAEREKRQAYDHAKEGGQALHVMPAGAPLTSIGYLRRAKSLGHLFDQDVARLESTAASLGVRRIVIHQPGTDRQHVNLCGAPLRQAMILAEQEAAC